MVEAHTLVKTGLARLIAESWRIPRRLHARLRYALLHSMCPRAQTLRSQCALVGHIDLTRTFETVLTPAFVVELFDDLRVAGRFSQHETSLMQDAVLRGVDRTGAWKPEEEVGGVGSHPLITHDLKEHEMREPYAQKFTAVLNDLRHLAEHEN